jgi:hypothetical protein
MPVKSKKNIAVETVFFTNSCPLSPAWLYLENNVCGTLFYYLPSLTITDSNSLLQFMLALHASTSEAVARVVQATNH